MTSTPSINKGIWSFQTDTLGSFDSLGASWWPFLCRSIWGRRRNTSPIWEVGSEWRKNAAKHEVGFEKSSRAKLWVSSQIFHLSGQITIIPKPECFGHFGGMGPLLFTTIWGDLGWGLYDTSTCKSFCKPWRLTTYNFARNFPGHPSKMAKLLDWKPFTLQKKKHETKQFLVGCWNQTTVYLTKMGAIFSFHLGSSIIKPYVQAPPARAKAVFLAKA